MIIGMTVLALVLIGVFGRSFSGADKPDVILVDLDGSKSSAAFGSGLIETGGFDYEYENYDTAAEKVVKGNVVGAVVIEAGFGDGILTGESKVTLLKAGESLEQFSLQSNIEGVGRQLALEENFLETMPSALEGLGIDADEDSLREELREQVEKYPVLTVSPTTYKGEGAGGYDSLRHSFIGFILFFSMFTMVFGIGSIVEEKENRVWQRQTVAPVSLAKVLAGNMLATFTVSMIQLTLMIVISRLVFDIDWGGSLPALLLVLSAYVIAATCLGLVMTGFVTTSQQLGSFSPIVVVSTSMIGGCMWPLEIITSKTLRFLADLTPQRWAYKGLKAVIIGNGGMPEVMDSLLLLLIISVVLFGFAMVPYKWSTEK